MYESPLENLSDEVILNILGYVKIQDLINCGQTSKRIRAITQDETLWQRVDGGFQLAFVSISRVINHMTCYNSSALIGGNLKKNPLQDLLSSLNAVISTKDALEL